MSMVVGDAAPKEPKPTPNTPSNVLEQFSLKGKVAVVGGASDGIGLAVAEAYVEAGADVAFWYNSNDTAIAKAKALAEKHGVKTKAYQVQVTDPQRIEEAMNEVVKDFGKMDIFVANAGAALSKGLLEMSMEEIKKITSINFDGVIYCAKSAGAIFKRQGSGNLIITSSISAHIVNVPLDQPIYNATKAAVTQLGKSLAREWRDFARVNMVSPGFFETKLGAADDVKNEAYRMTPLGRQGNTKEIKGLFLYLASDASSYQTGSDVIIDGGYTLP